jgi:hypothetical protein
LGEGVHDYCGEGRECATRSGYLTRDTETKRKYHREKKKRLNHG